VSGSPHFDWRRDDARTNRTTAWLVASAAATVAAAAIAFSLRPSDSLPIYLPVARSLAQGAVPSGFVPAGYPIFLCIVHRLLSTWAGPMDWTAAIVLGHGCLVVVTAAITVRAIYRLGGRLSWGTSALVGLLVAVMLLRTVTRADDNALAVPLTLACFVWLLSPRMHPASYATTGACLGALILVRPNMAVVVLPIAWIMLTKQRPGGLTGIVATATLVSMFLPGAYGYRVPFIPENGAYNAFVGNNPFVRDAVLNDGNPESSLGLALAYFELPSAPPQAFWWQRQRPVSDAVLRDTAVRWAVSHPAAWVGALAYKTYCLVLPPPASNTAARVLNIVLLMIPAAGLAAVLYGRRQRRVARSEVAMLWAFCLLFCGPLVLFVSPARLRLPLDLCLVVAGLAAATRPSSHAQGQ
jgi:hypothetical protein